MRSRDIGRRKILGTPVCVPSHQKSVNGTDDGLEANGVIVGAGFLTGGSLAIRGGVRAARNSAIGCAILLAVIEGVGIGIQRMMAENTRLDVWNPYPRPPLPLPIHASANKRNRYQHLRRPQVRRHHQ